MLSAAALLLSAAPPSVAQEVPTVTLHVRDHRVEYPTPMKVTGTIDPAGADQSVAVWTVGGELLAAVTTAADGSFAAEIFLERNEELYAMWGESRSESVDVQVRPDVAAKLKPIQLFGKARLIVDVSPSIPDGIVNTSFFRNGKSIGRRQLLIQGGRVRTSFPVLKAGRYHLRVEVSGTDNARGRARTRSLSPKLRPLGEGSRGPAVKALERRLMRLGYHLDGADRVYDYRTSDAIRAFNKVQGRPRLGNVDEGTLRTLGSPFRPKPRSKSPRFHIEIDQTRQVLYVVRKGRITDIIHVSTGAGSATRDGVFHFHRKLAGYSGNGLYYPSYFDGLRAIHGWDSVPTYNASHGCVRVPNWTAVWIFGLTEVGDEIRIYH